MTDPSSSAPIANKPESDQEPDPDAAKAYYANYAEYNKTLRTWFVSFGIAVPALFLVNASASEKLLQSGVAKEIVIALLIGCASQILVAILNKYSSWHAYAESYNPKLRIKRGYRFWSFVSEQIWLDIAFDVFSICAFGYVLLQLFWMFVPESVRT